jgi:hypothetical protein
MLPRSQYPIVRFASGVEAMIKPEQWTVRGPNGESAKRTQVRMPVLQS